MRILAVEDELDLQETVAKGLRLSLTPLQLLLSIVLTVLTVIVIGPFSNLKLIHTEPARVLRNA